MDLAVKASFVNELRTTALAQVEGCELVMTDTLFATDAFGLLAILYCSQNPVVIAFIPSRTAPGEYFFGARKDLIRWADLSDDEVSTLIALNDEDGMSFSDIADFIEEEWS